MSDDKRPPVFDTEAAAEDIAQRLRVEGTAVTPEFVLDVMDRHFELTRRDESPEDPAERAALAQRIASEAHSEARIVERILQAVDQELAAVGLIGPSDEAADDDRVGSSGFDPLDAGDISARLVALGVPVSPAEVVAVMSAHAELSGHSELEGDRAESSGAVRRVANATGRREDIVAAILNEVDGRLRQG